MSVVGGANVQEEATHLEMTTAEEAAVCGEDECVRAKLGPKRYVLWVAAFVALVLAVVLGFLVSHYFTLLFFAGAALKTFVAKIATAVSTTKAGVAVHHFFVRVAGQCCCCSCSGCSGCCPCGSACCSCAC